MSVEELPSLRLPDLGNIQDAGRPVLSYAWRAEGPHRAAAHRHARAHIIFVESGAYWVVTPEGTWLVPAGQAIWIPPLIHHEVYAHGSVAALVLFVDPAHAGALPGACGTVKVTPFLAALLHRCVARGNDYGGDDPATRLARVMLDELATLEFAPLLLPISKEPRLRRVLERLIREPQSRDGLEEAARMAAASPRTLARLFRSELGMTFTQWKTRLVLTEASRRLAEGASVTEVAMDLGYATPSSFVFAFRRHLGVPPGRYRGDSAASGRST